MERTATSESRITSIFLEVFRIAEIMSMQYIQQKCYIYKLLAQPMGKTVGCAFYIQK